MPADPAILQRIRGCPFARGGRVLVRFRANGYRPGRPALRPAAGAPAADRRGHDVVLLYPSDRGGWEPPGGFGAVAMPLNLALEHLSANPYFLELRQTYC